MPSVMDDQRKSALITGCSPGGIGHSLAIECQKKGLRVFATARKATVLSNLADLGIETLDLEVDKTESIKAAKQEIIKRTGGRLDYLFNNAGRNCTIPALDVPIEEIRQTFEVNLFAVIMMCQEFAPLLIEAKGTIVQTGSVAGLMPFVFGSVYNASKAALHSYSDTLRVELLPFGVKVVNVITGGVKSRIDRTDRFLPEGSLYIPLEEDYIRRTHYSQEGAMPNELYARRVVNKVVVSNPPRKIWAGAKIWLVWLSITFPPGWVTDRIWYNMFNLWKATSPAHKKKL